MQKLAKSIIFGFLLLCSLQAANSGQSDDLSTLRTQTVIKAKADFAVEIAEYKTRLGVVSDNLALLALAKDKLEKFAILPSDPDWAILIHNVLLGYGFDALPIGTDEKTKEIIGSACMYSAGYMQAIGNNASITLENLQATDGLTTQDLQSYVNHLDACVSAISDDLRVAIRSDIERLNVFKTLSSGNSWFAHERFWAVAGVLSPDAVLKLNDSYLAYRSTGGISDIEFLNSLTADLNQIIETVATTNTVSGSTTREMVWLSQQILLTITAGTPSGTAYARLVPANQSDWENIRKALFLALSVSEHPSKGGHTFLATVYDLGRFYHEKTDTDSVKEYYWRLEAYGNAFSSLWENLSTGKTDAQVTNELANVLTTFLDPLYRWLNSNAAPQSNMTDQRCVSESVYRRAYQSAFTSVATTAVRSELEKVLNARPKLNLESFQELYPLHTAWTEYHIPTKDLASEGGDRVNINIPAAFAIDRVKLDYQAGKWSLKAVTNNSIEHVIWQQSDTAKEDFFGTLKDKRGQHFYSFCVNGATATIRAISSGYKFVAMNDNTTIIVDDGMDFGILDISSFPRDVDNWKDDDNVIAIKALKFVGKKGYVAARRGGVWLEGQEIDLNHKKSVKKSHTNGQEYDHFSVGGQTIGADRFVTLVSDKIDISGASLYSRQMAQLVYANGGYLWSLASIIDAPHILIYSNDWHPDTQVTYAGIPGVDPYQGGNVGSVAELNRRQAAMTTNHDQTILNYSKDLHYFLGSVVSLNDAEFKVQLQGSHAYGRYCGRQNTCPTFTSYTTVTVVQPQGGGRGGVGSNFGSMGRFGSGGFGFAGFGPHGNLGSSALASMAIASTQVSAANLSISNRGGAVNLGGNLTYNSILGSTTMGFGSTHGGYGSTTTVHSSFTPPSLNQAAAMIGAIGIDPLQVPAQQNPLLMLHGFNAQSIQLLSQPRNSYAAPIISALARETVKKAAVFGSRVVGVVKTVNLAKEGLEEGQQKLQDEQKKQGANSATGGDPDGGDKKPEDTEKQTDVTQGTSQASHLGKPNSIYEQIGDNGAVKSRTFYDGNGRMFSRQDFEGSKPHNEMLPHEHFRRFADDGKPITAETVYPLPSGYSNAPTA